MNEACPFNESNFDFNSNHVTVLNFAMTSLVLKFCPMPTPKTFLRQVFIHIREINGMGRMEVPSLLEMRRLNPPIPLSLQIRLVCIATQCRIRLVHILLTRRSNIPQRILQPSYWDCDSVR
jgi:hypothetical protein